MKKLTLRGILVVILFSQNFLFGQQPIKIGVIADTHYMHPSLVVKKGEAFEAYLRQDRKLLDESDALLRETVDRLMAEEVNVVLIPGDLTKDGEKVSHQGVTQILQPLREKGVKILVIPGNHDINNPHAVAFDGNVTQQVATVSPEDFRAIYDEYGYNTAISFDSTSLSYVNEPVEGFRVLCLDVCKYYENTFISHGDDEDECVTGGYLKPSTLAWAKEAIIEAKNQGKQIVAMMHHNLVEHFEFQHIFASPYLIDNYEEVQCEFLNLGLNMVFTGHFHSSDIARVSNVHGNQLFDIETGSIVTFPCPYRIIEMRGDELAIETKFIDKINRDLPNGIDFHTYAQKQIERGFGEMVSVLMHDYHHEIAQIFPRWTRPFFTMPNPDELSEMFITHLSASATKAVLAHYSGNENFRKDAFFYEAGLMNDMDAFIHDFSKKTAGIFSPILERSIQKNDYIKKFKMAAKSIWADMVVSQSPDQITALDLPFNDLAAVIKLPFAEENPQPSFAQNSNLQSTIAPSTKMEEIQNQQKKYSSFFR